MKTVFAYLLAPLAIFVLCHSALAAEQRATQYSLGTLVSGLGLNAARTATVDLQYERAGYDILALTVEHTNVSGALTITMDCYNDPDAAGGTSIVLQDCTVSTGICTSSDATWEKAVTASKSWPWRVDIAGFPGQVSCVFSASGAAAGDTITVKGWLVTK